MISVDTTPETWYFYHTDRLGSVVALSHINGQLVERYGYDVFGQVRILTPDFGLLTSSQVGNPIMYTGRWYNTATGLYDYRFRMYDPTLGRFLQPDPLGTIDGMNLYAYVNNNPLNFIDPWGLCKEEEDDERSLWDKFCDWFWGNVPQEAAEEAVEQAAEKLYVNDGDQSFAGEGMQAGAKMGLFGKDAARAANAANDARKAKKVAKAAKKLRDEAAKEYRRKGSFTDYFHNHYKNKQKIPGGKGIKNPNMNPDEMAEAYEEWLRLGKPDWR